MEEDGDFPSKGLLHVEHVEPWSDLVDVILQPHGSLSLRDDRPDERRGFAG